MQKPLISPLAEMSGFVLVEVPPGEHKLIRENKNAFKIRKHLNLKNGKETPGLGRIQGAMAENEGFD